MRRFNLFFALVTVFFSFAFSKVSALEVPEPSTEFYVQDLADLVSASAEAQWLDAAKSLAQDTGAQVVLLTIPSLEDEALEDFSIKVARSWGIGDGKDNTGVLVFLVADSHEIRIEIGYGLEGVLPDGATGRLMREYLIPKLKENDYDGGVLDLENAIIAAVRGELDLKSDTDSDEKETLISLIFALVVFGGGSFCWFGSQRNWWRKCPKCGQRKWTESTHRLSALKEQTVFTCQGCHYQKKGPIVKIINNIGTGSFGSGSSFGGGSSSSSSGGGGSFGGGGSSGKW